MPGADVGIRAEDPTIAELLKPLGYATGQFGKNHLGDKDEFLPTVHGFDEFFGNLYHLNAEEEPEDPDYPKDPAFKRQFGPRGVLHCWADGKGGQKIEDTGPLTRKRMETIDDEATDRALAFIDKCHKEGKPFFIWYNTAGSQCPSVLYQMKKGFPSLWHLSMKASARSVASSSIVSIRFLVSGPVSSIFCPPFPSAQQCSTPLGPNCLLNAGSFG